MITSETGIKSSLVSHPSRRSAAPLEVWSVVCVPPSLSPLDVFSRAVPSPLSLRVRTSHALCASILSVPSLSLSQLSSPSPSLALLPLPPSPSPSLAIARLLSRIPSFCYPSF
uniref:Uncharacterized protein n=1 Tax=Chrysotila carterae TaxID=13221 RepID=A0A7S4EUA1_CHRCT|mmetsp:Transcript_48078/g.104141  ORF Transcript_48078/g.104141 Transcript_48078/m.104141 type:complete len:113 (-) Transcript_48078:332-670(-)